MSSSSACRLVTFHLTGPTAEELMEIKRMEEEGRMMGEAEERALMEKQEAEEQQERKKRQEDWVKKMKTCLLLHEY